jgi:HEAT repeat protein
MTDPEQRMEPQLGGGRWRQTVSGREPSLGGDRRFDLQVWGKLIDPHWSAKEALIAELSSPLCELYASLLIKILPEGSSFSQSLDGGAVWSGRYTVEQRAAAAYSLGLLGARLGGDFAATLVDPLLVYLNSREDEQVRCEVAQALGLLGDGRAEGPLMQAMTGGGWRFRLAAIRALGQVGQGRTLELLEHLQQGGESLNEATAALEALGVLGSRLGGRQRREIFDTLMQIFVRGAGPSRCAAARALGLLGDSRALDALIQAAIHGRAELQCAAVQALGMLGDPHAVPPLIGVLTASGYTARRDSVEALIHIGQAAVGPALAVLRHPDPEVRCAVIEVLGKVRAAEAVEALIDILDDEETDVRQAAVYALGVLGDPQAVEPLVRMLIDPDSVVRKEAAVMLGGFGDGRAVGPLCLALWDIDMTVRWFAAYALGTLGDPRAVRSLSQVLGDRSEHVANTAADSLVRIGDASVPVLAECARQRKRAVQELALGALQRIGTPAAQAALDGLGSSSA